MNKKDTENKELERILKDTRFAKITDDLETKIFASKPEKTFDFAKLAVAAVFFITAGILGLLVLSDSVDTKPKSNFVTSKKPQLTEQQMIAKLKTEIARAGQSAKLMAFADQLNTFYNTPDQASQVYTQITERYPETTAAKIAANKHTQ